MLRWQHHAVLLALCLGAVWATPARARAPARGVDGGDLPLKFWTARLDKNGDGVLTEDEFRTFLYEMDGDEAPSERFLALAFAQYDANGDGQVSLDEYNAVLRDEDSPVPFAGDVIVSMRPEQLHLSLTGNPTEMDVMWTTNALVRDGVVQWGDSEGKLSHEAQGESWTYHAGTLGWSGRLHHARMTGLRANARVFYRVGKPGALGMQWSAVESFVAAPTADAPRYPLRVATYGDMGTVMPLGLFVARALAKEHARSPFAMTLHAGDVAYGGTGGHQEFEGIWDLFMRQIEPWAKQSPYMVSVGNHEKYFNFTSFKSRFRFPGGAPQQRLWYGFDFGRVHFTMMDTEHDYARGSAQYAFLERDLAAAAANPDVAWLIFSGHRPMYSSDAGTDSGALQKDLETLLVKYGVDVCVWGHMHELERTYPVAFGKVTALHYENPEAPVHLTIGTAGALIHEKWSPQPAWSALRHQWWGFSVMEFASDEKMHWTFTKLFGGEQGDAFTIVKKGKRKQLL